MPPSTRLRQLSSQRCISDSRSFQQQKRRRRPPARQQRLNVQAIIPMLSGDATKDTPPDLASYLFKERIVYLGMPLVPAVTELLLAEFMHLQYQDKEKPIDMYINSTGVQKNGQRLGNESEAFCVYDVMRMVTCPIRTLCVGVAFGESALLLAAGAPGKRAALPSTTMMLRQPVQRFEQMQASDVDIYRNEIRIVYDKMTTILSRHTGHSQEKLKRDTKRPRYFSAPDAVEYNLIDKVLESENTDVSDALRKMHRGVYEWGLADDPTMQPDEEKEKVLAGSSDSNSNAGGGSGST